MATETDNVNSGALGTIVALGTVSMLSITLVVTALVRAETVDEMEKKDVGVDRPYRDLVAEQTAKLSAPAAYVNRGSGLVSLPIERAMEVTVEGLKKDPNSATPPAPQGGSGGTGGTATTETGGTAGETGGTGGTASVEGAELKASEEAKPAEEKKDEKKKDEKKKEGAKPKPAAAVPVAPAPAAPPPAPAPAAPNGQ
jgi:hypothetical protein